MVYNIKEIKHQGESIFVLLEGSAHIKEGCNVKDENGNVYFVKAVMSICTGCTMCFDTMLNVRLVEKISEIGTKIIGGSML